MVIGVHYFLLQKREGELKLSLKLKKKKANTENIRCKEGKKESKCMNNQNKFK